MGSRQVKPGGTTDKMTDPNIPIGATAIKPVERHGWEAFSWFMYDKNTGAIMGRTPLSWLLITVFYIIYYTWLASGFSVSSSSTSLLRTISPSGSKTRDSLAEAQRWESDLAKMTASSSPA